MQFEQHEINLDCTGFEQACFDVAIDGLGWFSVQGKGFVQLYLNLPPGVKYHIRDISMRPWEVKNKGGLDNYKEYKNRYLGMNRQYI